MASQVELANRALTKVGAARILSLTDDLESARTINAVWDSLRDAELRKRNWNFAIQRDSLAALASAPDWGFSYQYQLPADCLRVIQAGEYFPGVSLTDYRGVSESMWKVEGGRILTDLGAPLAIRYISRVTDCQTWDALFAEYFACRLAVELCERLTQSNTKKEMLIGEAKMALREASGSGAIENPPEPIQDTAWTVARL